MKAIFWNVLLFIAVLLFFVGLRTNQMEYYIGALILGIIIRIVGFEYIAPNYKKKKYGKE